jgi:hypothetical protein
MDYLFKVIVSVIQSAMRNYATSSSYLLEPRKGILRKVVTLRMSQDILGQGREDSLEISTLSGSHGGYVVKRQRIQRRDKQITQKPKERIPRGGTVWWVCFLQLIIVTIETYTSTPPIPPPPRHGLRPYFTILN